MSDAEIRDVCAMAVLYVVLIRLQALDLRSIKSHQWRILSCSAITGMNLVEGLDWVVNDIAGRLYYSTTTMPDE